MPLMESGVLRPVSLSFTISGRIASLAPVINGYAFHSHTPARCVRFHMQLEIVYVNWRIRCQNRDGHRGMGSGVPLSQAFGTSGMLTRTHYNRTATRFERPRAENGKSGLFPAQSLAGRRRLSRRRLLCHLE